MRKTGSYLTKGLFILLFMVILGSGFVLYLTGYTPATTLSGAYVKETLQLPEGRREKLAGIGSGSLFSEIEKIYNQDFPLRPVAIKVNNTIDFLQGKSSNTAVYIGKNHELYESEYLWDYSVASTVWDGRANRETIRSLVEKLSGIRDAFRKEGKHIYVLITPNKTNFSEDNIPEEVRQIKAQNPNGKRNIEVLKEYFDEYQIPYFDSSDYLRDSLPKGVIPFYRSGIHYSWAAGYYVARELFARIEEETGLTMPHFDLTVKEQSETVFPNRDLFDLLNTIPEITGSVYRDQPQQQVYIENMEASPVSILMQGGSFLGPYVDMNNRYPGIFRWFDIIQNTMFLPQGDAMVTLSSIRDVDLNRIKNDQLFVFEINETSAQSMSFGFIDYLSEYLGTADLTSVKPYGLVFTDAAVLMATQPYGLYDLSAYQLPWRFTAKQFGCRLENGDIFTNGLAIQVTVTDDLKASAKDGRVAIDVTVNGIHIGEYEPDENGIIRVSAADLTACRREDGTCLIDCAVNSSFIPHELNPESPDTRELAVILHSITAGLEEDKGE